MRIKNAYISSTLKAMGFNRFEINRQLTWHGASTGWLIVSLYGYDATQHPPVAEILSQMPLMTAVEVIFEAATPDAKWLMTHPPKSLRDAMPKK